MKAIRSLLIMIMAIVPIGCSHGPPEVVAFEQETLRNPTALAKLLDGGLDPNTRSRDMTADTLLWRAVRNRELPAVKLLLDRGARVDEKSEAYQKTALFHAAYDGSLEIVTLLLDRGANPNALDMLGNNPLREAALGDRPAVVRLLLDRGSNPNQINKDGQSMKELAAKYGSSQVTEALKPGKLP